MEGSVTLEVSILNKTWVFVGFGAIKDLAEWMDLNASDSFVGYGVRGPAGYGGGEPATPEPPRGLA